MAFGNLFGEAVKFSLNWPLLQNLCLQRLVDVGML